MSTHQIVSMKKASTKKSKSAYWQCVTADDQRVNVFQHADPDKDTSKLFADAGYLLEMAAMAEGEIITWEKSPINVTMRKDLKEGKWWEVTAVEPRPADAQPDLQYEPPLELYRIKACSWAYAAATALHSRIWDVETTGIDNFPEIVSIAILNSDGGIILDTLVKPCDLERLNNTVGIHGITPEQLANAPTFPEVYQAIHAALDGNPWIVYNAGFDPKILEQNCLMHGLTPIVNIGINDAMQIAAEFFGEWDKAYQRFKSKKLIEAAEVLGIEVSNAHNALADAHTTLKVVEHLAFG